MKLLMCGGSSSVSSANFCIRLAFNGLMIFSAR
jgi:hypothetical protein